MATQGVLTFVEPFIPVVLNLFPVTPPISTVIVLCFKPH